VKGRESVKRARLLADYGWRISAPSANQKRL